jgi:hypothetical protein
MLSPKLALEFFKYDLAKVGMQSCKQFSKPVVCPVSQDERNAVGARVQYEVTPRISLAVGGKYDSGLPIEFG